MVDNDAPAYVFQYKWNCIGGGAVKSGSFQLGLGIFGRVVGSTLDHIDRNKHNNQKHNLREATYQENNWNRKVSKRNISGYKGVCVTSNGKRPWRAEIYKDGITYRLGRFFNAIDAAKAYNAKAKELFGEFAYLNVIPEGDPQDPDNEDETTIIEDKNQKQLN